MGGGTVVHHGGSHGGKSVRCPQSGSRDPRTQMLNSFLLLFSIGPPAHRMVPPAFKVGLLTSISPIWKLPPRHTERFVSMVILNATKLARLIITANIMGYGRPAWFLFLVNRLRIIFSGKAILPTSLVHHLRCRTKLVPWRMRPISISDLEVTARCQHCKDSSSFH